MPVTKRLDKHESQECMIAGLEISLRKGSRYYSSVAPGERPNSFGHLSIQPHGDGIARVTLEAGKKKWDGTAAFVFDEGSAQHIIERLREIFPCLS
jgi:hypothetical protein